MVSGRVGNECVDSQRHIVDAGPERCEIVAPGDEDAAIELKQQCAVGGEPVGSSHR